ncbi:VOC family protein [Saccharomonospora sp. NPDC006951]
MITGMCLVCVRVRDQQEALDFYVDKLGMKVAFDAEHDGFRYLLVAAPGQPELQLMLVGRGGPVPESVERQLDELLAIGALSPGAFRTEDCRATYAELSAKGVEFIEEPEERFYGIDAAFRDPSGNHWRLTQPKPI